MLIFGSQLFDKVFLRDCRGCAVERGLLDAQDNGLIVDAIGNADQQEVQADQQHFRCKLAETMLIPAFFIVLPNSVWFPCTMIFLFILPSMLHNHKVLPRLICWLWSARVDAPFQHFVNTTLRQHELAHCSPAADERTRVRLCLRQLCQFVRHFNAASLQLLTDSREEERANLLFNFVDDEMRKFCPPPNEEMPKIDELDETDLHLNTLKSIWRYHFRVRSEFIRIALLFLFNNHPFCFVAPNSSSAATFCLRVLLILRTVYATSSLQLPTADRRNCAPKLTPKSTIASDGDGQTAFHAQLE